MAPSGGQAFDPGSDHGATIGIPVSPSGKAGVSAGVQQTLAWDDVRARRLMVGSRLLTQRNAEVSRVGALSAPARPTR